MPETPHIFVACHKSANFPNDQSYIPIHCGKALSETDFDVVGDDRGDNISQLNPSFCELTALYWIWKNVKHDVIGLMHYRRYLKGVTEKTDLGGHQIAAGCDFHEFSQGYDLILPSPIRFCNPTTDAAITVEQQYADYHIGLDLVLARDALLSQQPSYEKSWENIMRNHSCFLFNMFVGRKSLIDQYCAWLFPLLFEIHKYTPRACYDSYQTRSVAFIAERLFNVWIAHNIRSMRISFRPTVFV